MLQTGIVCLSLFLHFVKMYPLIVQTACCFHLVDFELLVRYYLWRHHDVMSHIYVLIPSPLDFGVLISNIPSDFGAYHQTLARPSDIGITIKLWSLTYKCILNLKQNLISGRKIQYDSLVKATFFKLLKNFMTIWSVIMWWTAREKCWLCCKYFILISITYLVFTSFHFRFVLFQVFVTPSSSSFKHNLKDHKDDVNILNNSIIAAMTTGFCLLPIFLQIFIGLHERGFHGVIHLGFFVCILPLKIFN